MEIKEVNVTNEKLLEHPGLVKAIKDHPGYLEHRFRGIWKGVTYAMFVYMGIALLGATGSYFWAIVPTVVCSVLYYLTHSLHSVLVKVWNQRELEKVITDWTAANLQEVIKAVLPTDSIEDLDGTKGEE